MCYAVLIGEPQAPGLVCVLQQYSGTAGTPAGATLREGMRRSVFRLGLGLKKIFYLEFFAYYRSSRRHF
jgi:hypothetical protein